MGRKSLGDKKKIVSAVSISKALHEKAKEIGEGNFSKGVTEALERAENAKNSRADAAESSSNGSGADSN